MKATPAPLDAGEAGLLRRSGQPHPHLERYSFGSTSAIVTSVGVIVGFGPSAASRPWMVSSLLIIALADNITDSLSIHVYQESEQLNGRAAFRATMTNFVTRLIVAASFVALVVALPTPLIAAASLAWGAFLLASLTYALARSRDVRPLPEIFKHLVVAVIVVAVSRALGSVIHAYVH
jgi:VIT1/CCC1 family predicted Fe2+/Mn2+ transporter